MKQLAATLLIISFLLPSLIQAAPIAYTDENLNENLIIKSDKEFYGGWDKIPIEFSITNESDKDQDVTIQFKTPKNEKISEVVEWVDEDYIAEEDVLGPARQINCADETGRAFVCNVQDKIGTQEVTKTRSYWKAINLASSTDELSQKYFGKFNAHEEITHSIKKGETRNFKAQLDIDNVRTSGQFIIEAFGDQAYGVLDPWFDSTFTYCRKMTMTAGGTSGGVATTTTLGYTLVATTTLADLKYSTFGGKIQKMDTLSSSTSSPLDLIFTSGTDCNTAGGSLLNFHIEKYASSTGDLIAWIKATDISSTTPKTVLMYYGKASATDQRNETGTYPTDYVGAYHFATSTGTTLNVYDSTSNDNDGTITGATATTSQFSAGSRFDGVTNKVTVTAGSELNITASTTLEFWLRVNAAPAAGVFDSIVSKRDASGGPASYSAEINPNTGGVNRMYLWWTQTGTTFVGYRSTTPFTVGTLEHWFITRNGTGVYMMKNGVDAVSVLHSAAGLFVGQSTTAAVDFGDFTYTDASSAAIDLEEVRISNIARHPMDGLTDYNNQVCSACFWTMGAEETQTAAGASPQRDDIIWFETE